MAAPIAYTLGIDLATEAKGTGLCKLKWTRGGVEVVTVAAAATDSVALAEAKGCAAVGIDAPFGWPAQWSSAVGRFRPGANLDATGTTAELTKRATDRFVRAKCGLWPMSVAADRIGATAIRSVRLVRLLVEAGFVVDLGAPTSRAPFVSEVYPAAALKMWGFPHRSYKPSFGTAACSVYLDPLIASLRLVASERQLMCLRSSADAFDGLVAALVARAVTCDHTLAAPPVYQPDARAEGWIRFPAPGAAIAGLV